MHGWSRSTTCPTWPKARCPGRRRVLTDCKTRGVAMRQSLRRWNGLSIVALPLLGACYVYAPVTTPDPQPGVRLRLDLNVQGPAALVTSVGPEARPVDCAPGLHIGSV